jgi:hypothetical protein
VAHGLGTAGSPWDRVPMDVPPAAFGPGSRAQFPSYFEGQSRVRVDSIDEIVEWLSTCEYVSDTDQFQQQDVWQQPCAFERRQRGDCEDFALWAWRKLAEIGVDAEFFVGRVVCESDPAKGRQHAWVVYRDERDEVLFEPAARERRDMLRPLAAVRDAYVPHFAIDRRFVTSAFVGCLLEPVRDPSPI